MTRTGSVSRSAIFGSGLAGALAVAVALAPGASAATVTITELVGVVQAAAGNGWAAHPDQTAGGTEEFVDGPGTPPAGDGSLQLSVADGTDRALIFTVPSPGTGATAPGDLGPIDPTPWSGLSGSSYSTYTTATTSIPSSVVTMRFVGYQDFNTNNPLLSTGFTTLNFEPINNGTVLANQWQKWNVSDSSMVWQSNATGSFCVQAAPCALSAFAAQYPNGAWGQVQLGIGALGTATDVSSNVDDVTVAEGNTTFGYNFEVAAASVSPSPTPSASVSPSATFVPGPGNTGDSEPPSTTPWSAILVGAGAVMLGSFAALRTRRRGKHE